MNVEDFSYKELIRALQEVPAIPVLLQRQFPQIFWEGSAARQEIALTFDDGPDRRDTLALLEVLARERVTATFCHVGERVAANPGLTATVAAAGHQVGLHGYRHQPFVLLPPELLHTQLDRTRDLVARVTNRPAEAVVDVRPPYGAITPALADTLVRWGYRPLIGGIVPVHWLQPREQTVAQILQYAHPGGVIVLHETLGGPPITRIVAEIIPRLAAQGYSFVTVAQMRQP
jgi:peptidoglycan/xylan/chitin deacetylase (PgdA/CDA1 family)